MNNYRKKHIEIAVDERLKHFARHIAWVATGGLQDDISPQRRILSFRMKTVIKKVFQN